MLEWVALGSMIFAVLVVFYLVIAIHDIPYEIEDRAYGSKVPVLIDLDEDLSEFHLPAGVIGSAAIYTKHVHHVALLRKILLRMVSWRNDLFGELH